MKLSFAQWRLLTDLRDGGTLATNPTGLGWVILTTAGSRKVSRETFWSVHQRSLIECGDKWQLTEKGRQLLARRKAA